MTPQSESAITASFLRCGRVLSDAGNCAAAIGGVGMFLTHAVVVRLLLGASLLCWPIAVYFGVRVALDAALFRELAGGPPDGWNTLDEFLRTRGLSRHKTERTVAERSRGAMRLLFRLFVAVAFQLALLAAALATQAWMG